MSQETFYRARLLVGSILFMMLFGFIRNIILDVPMDAKGIVTTTILFIVWLGLSDMITNAVIGTPRFNIHDDSGAILPPEAECP